MEEYAAETVYDASHCIITYSVSPKLHGNITRWTYDTKDLYDIRLLCVPQDTVVPVTGEFFQSLCDYTIIDRPLENYHGKSAHAMTPRHKHRFVEDGLSGETLLASSLFIYPYPKDLLANEVFSHTWPNLRIIIFHKSDYTLNVSAQLLSFLYKHPNVICWAENTTTIHPRIRPLPIAMSDSQWRSREVDVDPPITICRSGDGRATGILFPFCSATNAIRSVWTKQARELRTERLDLDVLPRIDFTEYEEALRNAKTVVCPPGNGYDTHRHWETLYMGAWGIVENNEHTKTLLAWYPSLPFITINDAKDLKDIVIPSGSPSPFHPMLLREYWKVLFRSYC